MTLLDIFYFMNFFVRPTIKKWRQKCAKKRPLGAPWPPLTPRNAFFGWRGMCSKLPRPKNAITLLYKLHLRCPVAISDFWGVFFAKMCVFGRFSALVQKIYFIHFFRSDKNIMSLKKRNTQILYKSLNPRRFVVIF